jgi:hypothetical protein
VNYADGNEACLGDQIAIDDRYRGVVVACMDRDEFSAEYSREQWGYLGRGIMVNTDFGGLIHYPDGADEHMVLISRAAAAG